MGSYYLVQDNLTPSHKFRFSRKSDQVERIYSREPGTIKWINSFAKDHVFLDIGACVGLYSIYASNKVKQVYAFEPHLANCSVLLENCNLNCATNVGVYNFALDAETRHGAMIYNNLKPGTTQNQFKSDQEIEETKQIDLSNKHVNDFLQDLAPRLMEKKISYPLDFLVGQCWIKMPDHIKLDVENSSELEVLKGMKKSLRQVTSIMINVQPIDNNGLLIDDFLADANFELVSRQETELTRRMTEVKKGKKIAELPHNALYRKKDLPERPKVNKSKEVQFGSFEEGMLSSNQKKTDNRGSKEKLKKEGCQEKQEKEGCEEKPEEKTNKEQPEEKEPEALSDDQDSFRVDEDDPEISSDHEQDLGETQQEVGAQINDLREKLAESIEVRLNSVELRNVKDYVYLKLDQFMPTEFYQVMVNSIDNLIELAEEAGEGRRLVAVTQENLIKLPGTIRLGWFLFNDLFQSDRVITKLLAFFKPALDKKYIAKDQSLNISKLKSRVYLSIDDPGHQVEPQGENPKLLIRLFFYLAKTEMYPHLGVGYLKKKSGNDYDLVDTIGYQPNRMVGHGNTDQVYHQFDLVGDDQRRLILNVEYWDGEVE